MSVDLRASCRGTVVIDSVSTYLVTATLPGFRVFKREGVELSAGFTATVNAELKVGSVAEIRDVNEHVA